jgi:DNA-binding response OmpR family regulator
MEVSSIMKSILIVEDDPIIQDTLKFALKDAGYAVDLAVTLVEERKLTATNSYDLVLQDLNLPDGVAFDQIRELKAREPSLPIVIITSNADEESAVRGLSLGVEDYLRKPFGRRELLLRIKKYLGERLGRVEVGDLVANRDRRIITFRGAEVPVTSHQFEILALLMEKAEEVVSRERILGSVDPEARMLDRTLNSHLSHIRSRLESAGATAIEIVPVYGRGYRLTKRK